MQRTNAGGIPFLRRPSVPANPVAYANPAATQFLRLGVGIDHVDVDQSDDEDVIYQGIENGMEGHHDTDLSDDDEDEDGDEDEDDEDEDEENDTGVEGAFHETTAENVGREHATVGGDALTGNAATATTTTKVASEAGTAVKDTLSTKKMSHDERTKSTQQEQTQTARQKHARSRSQALLDSDDIIINNNILDSLSKNNSNNGGENNSAQGTATTGGVIESTTTQAASSRSGSSSHPQHPQQPLQYSGTQTPGPASQSAVDKKHGSGNTQSQASASASTQSGLPVYHEKFSTKVHGSSPLSNTNNTITIPSELSNTSTLPSSQNAPSTLQNEGLAQNNGHGLEVAQVRRFAEKEGFVTIHAWKIHYKVCYPTFDPLYRINGNGRNIILFHDALSNLGTWRKVQQTLADRTGCRVLSFDRVGYGFSDKPSTWPKNANPYKNGGVMAITQSLLDILGMNLNLILIGNGTGATVASALALSKPANVRGLVLVAPSILNEAPPMYLRACVSYPAPLSWIYRSLYGNHGPLQQFYHKPATVMSDAKTMDMYLAPTKKDNFWQGLSNATKYRSSFRIEKHLGKLTEMSTLVMTGDVDDVVPTIETLRLFETLQSARQTNVPQVLKIIKHAGHLPHEEKPTDFVKVTSFFIKKVCLGSLSRERSVGGRSMGGRRASTGVVRTASKKSVDTTAGSSGIPGEPGHQASQRPAGAALVARRASTKAITNANTQANADVHINNTHGHPGPVQPKMSPPNSTPGAEQVIGPNGAPWHKTCYTCRECNRRLDASILAEHEGEAYCNNCHKARFGPTGYGYATGVLVRETPGNEFKQSIGRPPNSSGSTTDPIAHNYTGGSNSGRYTDVDSPRPSSSTTTTADEDDDARRREQLVPVNATLKKRSSLDMIREQAEASRRAYDEAHALRVAGKYGRVKADSTGSSTASSSAGTGNQADYNGSQTGYLSAGSDTSSAFGSTIATTSSPVPSFSSISSAASSQPPVSSIPTTKSLFLNQAYKPSAQTPDPESEFAKSRQALGFQTGAPVATRTTPHPSLSPALPSLPRRQPEPIKAPSSHGSEADTEPYMDYVPIRVVARKEDELHTKGTEREKQRTPEPAKHIPAARATAVVDEDEWDAEPAQKPQEATYKPSSFRTLPQKISPQPTPSSAHVNRLISETDKLSLREQEERRQVKESSETEKVDEWDEEPTPNVPSKPVSMNYQPARNVSPAATRTWTPTASTSEGIHQPVSSNVSTTFSHTRVSSGGSSGYVSSNSQTGYSSSGISITNPAPAVATAPTGSSSSSAGSSSTTTPKTSYYRSGGMMTPKKMPMTFGGGDICPRCQKTVYAAESALAPGGVKYHKLCLRCMECSKSLDSTNITDRQGEILCKTCYSKKYGAKGYGYGSGASMLHTEL
ncbi:hypothetical protein BG004_000673 [Podila humilis]|nr:hypothetical protein BG004_000673 [Podila humilis]